MGTFFVGFEQRHLEGGITFLGKKTQIPLRIAKYLLYLLLFITPMLRGAIFSWHKTFIEIIAFSIVALIIFAKMRAQEPFYKKTGVEKPLVVFTFFTLFSSYFSHSLPDTIDTLVLLVAYLAVFYAIPQIIATRQEQRQLVYTLLSSATLISVIAIIKSNNPELFSWWQYMDAPSSPNYYSGSFGNRNHLAGYLEMIIPFTLVLFLRRSQQLIAQIIAIVLVIFFIGCQMLTLSRSGWFSLGGGLFFMAILLLMQKQFAQKRIFILIIIAVFSVMLSILMGTSLFERALTLTDSDTLLSVNGRMQIWKSTGKMIISEPFIGSGPGSFATVIPKFQHALGNHRFYFAHNDYLQFIAEYGFLSFFCLLWGGSVILRKGIQRLNSKSRQQRSVTLASMTGIVAIMLHSFTDFNLHIPANALLLIVLSSLLCD